MLRKKANRRLSNFLSRTLAGAAFAICCSTALAQLSSRGPVHYRHSADMPPGTVGQSQLARGGPLRGYFQPVEIIPPQGALVALLVDGKFRKPRKDPIKAGMLIGQVYRFKVTRIPGKAGLEIYPTIEVVNRLYAPPGQATRHPIPVHLAIGDLEVAMSGRFVTRVIYLEDANNPFPHAEDPGRQRYFEVGPTQDPLQVADELGRPMAILRMGSRIPSRADAANEFSFGSPPLILLSSAKPKEALPKGGVAPPPRAAPRPQQKDPQATRPFDPFKPVHRATFVAPVDTTKWAVRQTKPSNPVVQLGPARRKKQMLDTAQSYPSQLDIHVPRRQIQDGQWKQPNAPLVPNGDLDLNTSSSDFGLNISQLRKSLGAKITSDYQPVVRRSAPAHGTRTKDTTTNRPGTTRTVEARASSKPRGTVLPARFSKFPSVE